MFQPRVAATTVAAGIALQLSWVFVLLACVLTIGAVWPHSNPFDAVYNKVVAPWNGGYRLQHAPLPRRFAQALAASLSGATALAINSSTPLMAVLLEFAMVGAMMAVFAARFCVGARLLHWLTGMSARAHQSCGSNGY
jgi:hypothetical protein